MSLRTILVYASLTIATVLTVAAGTAAAAAIPTGDFSLEVSPSPLVAQVEPGESKTLELKIRNASTLPEQLRIQIRGFSIAYPSQQMTITTNTPPDLAQWVSFAHPTFTVGAGQWFTQKVTVTLPEEAGFSYPFVLVVSRQNDPVPGDGAAAIRGSIAVFALINIDKPGATRKLELESITTDRSIYEYLPTKFNVKLKNTGNSIVQPYGNAYVQRPGKESSPLAVLPVNDSRGYILPGGTKQATVTWNNGFPYYKETESADGKTQRDLQWDWTNMSNIRFGRYTAKMVAVYNDGTRDVPVVGEVSFWVVPWRILLGLLVVIVIIIFGVSSIFRRFTHHAGRLINRRKP